RAACPLEEFRNRISHFQLTFASAPPAQEALPAMPGLLDLLRVNNTLRLTVANPAGDLEEALAALKPLELERQPINFQEAVTAYMSGRRNRGFFLEAVGGAA